MATSYASSAPASVGVVPASGLPWYVWCSVAAVTSAMIGVLWDISWHQSIGRDSFWTPAHLAIHLCGVLAGISCGFLILNTTFAQESPLRAASVRIWGFRGPLGAFIAAWGGIAMLTSAPFDNWWHAAYGLDVKILSPPHMILAAGMIAVQVGALVLILGYMNRATGKQQVRLRVLFLYVGGMILVALTTVSLELTSRVFMHSAHFYRVVATFVPLVLVGVARASRYKWGATAAAAAYMLFVMAMDWILPLFPAIPKLGPVLYPVTHFVPSGFPMLLIVPAFALDLLRQRTAKWSAWSQALVSGVVFLGTFAAVQWPFGSFLMSPAARNWFFSTIYFGYNTNPLGLYARYQFVATETAAVFWRETALALLLSVLLIRLALACGDRLQRIQR